MPALDAERLAAANELRRSLAIEDTFTPIQARSFVRCLQTSWRVPTIQWAAGESTAQFSEAQRLIQAAIIFESVENPAPMEAAQCYRRAAEILEWLSRSGDRYARRNMAQLLAAGAFQLGGLPAMAASLLGQVRVDDAGSHIFSQFFQADFDSVLLATSAFWKSHPELTERDAPSKLLKEDNPEKMSWYITTELIRSIGLIADCLRRGDEARLSRALAKIEALDRVVVRSLSDDVATLVTLLARVAFQYADHSIYKPIMQLAALRPNRTAKLRSLARGQFSQRRGILWISQREGLARLLAESSFALCTPTGSGKTLVANLALIKELLLQDYGEQEPLALYLVPSRALANEVERKLQIDLGRDFIITGLYGGTDWGITDYWLSADKPTVLVATVEKADALMRYIGPLLLGRLRVLILDEAHQVVPEDNDRSREAFYEHTSRPNRLESFVSRLLALSSNIVRIALTAVAGGAATPVAKWFQGTEGAQAVGTRYRSTRQLIGKLTTVPGARPVIELDIRNGKYLTIRGRDDAAYVRLRIPAMPLLPAGMRNSIYQFNELAVLWTALHLADGSRRILISVTERPETTMGWYRDALELPDWNSVPTFSPPIAPDEKEKYDAAVACCIDYCGADSHEIALLQRGIATNHGQMPQRLRRLMVELIDSKICPITIATATLTEGVNLPFDLVFVSSLTRSTYRPAENRNIDIPMSTAEFRNLAGRSGRPGTSNGLEGISLVAVPLGISTTARSQKAAQRRALRGLQAQYNNLIVGLVEDEAENGSVLSPLAMLLESIAQRAFETFGFNEIDEFLEWLDTTAPTAISEDAGKADISDDAKLADSLDELDSVLLSAVEEFSRLEDRELTSAEIEEFIVSLWKKTFTSVAAAQEEWLEQSFIRRGVGLVENVYPDADVRRKIYESGFSPVISRRFENVAPAMKAILAGAINYGTASAEDRFQRFKSLMELIAADKGYGFRARDTAGDKELLENREAVLRWWLQVDADETPESDNLRAWQRFVADNLEFRLGVAIGAVVAQAWSEGADDPVEQPSLDEWKDTTGLPWFGFWCREMLRWGTVDPFVAFVLSQGLAGTRERAAARRPEFEQWLNAQYEDLFADDKIDPQRFLEWQRSLPAGAVAQADIVPTVVLPTGTTGQRGTYTVTPINRDGVVSWIDPAGFELARSLGEVAEGDAAYLCDFELQFAGGAASVRRAYLPNG